MGSDGFRVCGWSAVSGLHIGALDKLFRSDFVKPHRERTSKPLCPHAIVPQSHILSQNAELYANRT